ncbi:MAG: hypothetical protein KAR65_09080 [Anaerolineales bacterium]|nr:hypothetical protein [Anaerolineales bacterium]MCK5634295.1 hypothetical protein [Anaerolineales bacterium]
MFEAALEPLAKEMGDDAAHLLVEGLDYSDPITCRDAARNLASDSSPEGIEALVSVEVEVVAGQDFGEGAKPTVLVQITNSRRSI